MKRSELKRKTPLARGTKGLKRSRLNRVSKTKRIARMVKAKERYADCHGICFDEIRMHLPDRVSAWPQYAIVDSNSFLELYRWFCRPCYLCRRYRQLEPHHLVGGSRGRSDDPCNLIAVCRECHNEVQSSVDDYQRCWRAKWEYDRDHCDWRSLVVLLGRWPNFDSLEATT